MNEESEMERKRKGTQEEVEDLKGHGG